MKLSSEKAQNIDQYLEHQTQEEIGKWPIEISGEKRILPFYRFPIGFSLGSPGILYYNINNGNLMSDKIYRCFIHSDFTYGYVSYGDIIILNE